jgi:hypothetical protein
MNPKALSSLFALPFFAVGCVSTSAHAPGGFPSRPEGCTVTVLQDAPTTPTTNIGPVRASCAADVPDKDCLRTLQDQVCKLGGDIVWGVADKPRVFGDRNLWDGRAARTGLAPKPALPQ